MDLPPCFFNGYPAEGCMMKAFKNRPRCEFRELALVSVLMGLLVFVAL